MSKVKTIDAEEVLRTIETNVQSLVEIDCKDFPKKDKLAIKTQLDDLIQDFKNFKESL